MKRKTTEPEGVGGWLLLLCLLLVAWGPIELGLVASSALAALPVRGLPLGLLISVRVCVAAFGLAAGLALLTKSGPALPMARASLVLTALTNAFVYATSYFPSNRMPGDDRIAIAGTVVYALVWSAYLAKSRRIRNTYR